MRRTQKHLPSKNASVESQEGKQGLHTSNCRTRRHQNGITWRTFTGSALLNHQVHGDITKSHNPRTETTINGGGDESAEVKSFPPPLPAQTAAEPKTHSRRPPDPAERPTSKTQTQARGGSLQIGGRAAEKLICSQFNATPSCLNHAASL